MPCYHPFPAFQSSTGEVYFVERTRTGLVRQLTLPCGQCVGCRLERSRQWAVRCVHEASLYDLNCFITLTYSDQFCSLSLVYRDFQLFMKRLRKFSGSRIRFFMCGEYGEDFGRPHFHACLFNFDFLDKSVWSRKGDTVLYRSSKLEELWPYGFASIGKVNFQTAAYVARYVMKKVTGRNSSAHYRVLDPLTGELVDREPEFCHMSLKPGIGAEWLRRFRSDVFPSGEVVVNGKKAKAPRYYVKKFFDSPIDEGQDDLEFERYLAGVRGFADSSDDRLAVKEQVAIARSMSFKREI